MIPEKPRLRHVQITASAHKGEEWFHFHDQSGIAPDVGIPQQFGPLLAAMDGRHTLQDLFDLVEGADVRPIIEKLVADLDEAYLLHSPRFVARQNEVESEFLSAEIRPAAFAGLSYPDNPAELRVYLTQKLKEGEKRLPPRRYEAAKVHGIVTPHIDFHRGGHSEAASYVPLRENVVATGKSFDTLVILGIAHEGVEYPFCATAKGFETPFGVMECDGDFVRDLEQKVGPQLLEEQLRHKNEHSIEFAAVFSQMFPELKPSKIVPILCGGFWESLRSGQAPEIAEPEVGEFIAALREVTQKHEKAGKKIGFIASVDGAHVGTQFGDDTPLTRAKLAQIQGEDRKWCAAIESGDKNALHSHFAKDGNRFHVDAHPALYTLMAAFPHWRGQLLDYDQAFTESANIVVSFASLALFEK